MCAMQKPEDFYPKSRQRGGQPRGPSGRGSSGGGSREGGSGSGPEWPPKFPYQANYFFENGHLKESLLTTEAEKHAYAFIYPPRQRQLTSAQLRRFYHD